MSDSQHPRVIYQTPGTRVVEMFKDSFVLESKSHDTMGVDFWIAKHSLGMNDDVEDQNIDLHHWLLNWCLNLAKVANDARRT